MMVRLQNPRRRMGGEVVETSRDELPRNDLVAVQNDEEIPLLGRIGQEVVEIARLETDRTVCPTDNTQPVLSRKVVDAP